MGITWDETYNVLAEGLTLEKYPVNVRYYDDGCEAILVFMCMQLLPGGLGIFLSMTCLKT